MAVTARIHSAESHHLVMDLRRGEEREAAAAGFAHYMTAIRTSYVCSVLLIYTALQYGLSHFAILSIRPSLAHTACKNTLVEEWQTPEAAVISSIR